MESKMALTLTVTRRDLEHLSDLDDFIGELVDDCAEVILKFDKNVVGDLTKAVHDWDGVTLVDDGKGNFRFQHDR